VGKKWEKTGKKWEKIEKKVRKQRNKKTRKIDKKSAKKVKKMNNMKKVGDWKNNLKKNIFRYWGKMFPLALSLYKFHRNGKEIINSIYVSRISSRRKMVKRYCKVHPSAAICSRHLWPISS